MNGLVVVWALLRVLAVLTLVTRLHIHDLTTVIRAARGAHTVREFQFLALRAHLHRRRFQIVVRPAAIAAPLRMLAFDRVTYDRARIIADAGCMSRHAWQAFAKSLAAPGTTRCQRLSTATTYWMAKLMQITCTNNCPICVPSSRSALT